jgi:Gpi18-like mannosyltransferase
LNFYPSFNIQYVPGVLFDFTVKIPFLISDTLVTLLLYKIIKEFTGNKGLAEKAAVLWFLNPFVIWISASWGMWDTIPALLSLATLYLLIKKRIRLSAICLSLGVACKLYPALFLVPIAIFLFKSSPNVIRKKNLINFFLIFAAGSVLLFLPYIGVIPNLINSYFAQITSSLADPLNNPIAFGLTYWSLFGLNRLISFPYIPQIETIVSILSVGLAVILIPYTYWRVSKMSFQKPIFDLATAFLLGVMALFLSYSIICEQFFIWAIPFLILLLVVGRVRPIYYWGLSFVALSYAVLNCPLPFFFLSLAPWATGSLLGMVHFIWWIEPLRLTVLPLLGLSFSLILLSMFNRIRNKSSQ